MSFSLLNCILATMLGTITLNTNKSTLVLEANQGEPLNILYYGAAISDSEKMLLKESGYVTNEAYPAYGLSSSNLDAVSIVQIDGSRTLDLNVTTADIEQFEDGQLLKVCCADPVYPVEVEIFYRTYHKQDMICTWTNIVNTAKKRKDNITLTRYDSGHLPIRAGNIWISSFYGAWGNEGRLTCEPLTKGIKVIQNTDGVRNSHSSRSDMMISLDGKPRENEGQVIGTSLCWGGNYKLRIQNADSDYAHFFAGICSDSAEYVLAPGESFTTPELAFSWSDEGLSGVSRNFHKWGREYKLAHGNVERRVLLNSWEGVYLDVNEPAMVQMASDIASMGGELFVMDDGWFGEKYARKIDDRGLGDWYVDKDKLPNGIASLAKAVKAQGVDFGIWIEPEMTNTKSELYEAHPDWVIAAPGRELITGRGGTQVLLDMSNPEVQDFVFSIVDNLMKEAPEISYIKWDANMAMEMKGTQTNGGRQSQISVDYWKGFMKTCERIREAYPDLTIQTCASGGGRTNWGVLPWFDEFWTSDNTDAYQRIFMQWGTSYFYPAIAMGAHISASPNHQLGRVTSIKFRCDVAMAGRLGMEIQPSQMTEREIKVCRQAISDYKRIRPLVQMGDIYRLVSPYDDLGYASLMHCAEDKSEAVFFWWRLQVLQDDHLARVRMAGLDPNKSYKVTELNRIDLEPLSYEGKVFSGKFLMDNGLEMPLVHNLEWNDKQGWSSRILLLEACN